jgi:hypothetical protein
MKSKGLALTGSGVKVAASADPPISTGWVSLSAIQLGGKGDSQEHDATNPISTTTATTGQKPTTRFNIDASHVWGREASGIHNLVEGNCVKAATEDRAGQGKSLEAIDCASN